MISSDSSYCSPISLRKSSNPEMSLNSAANPSKSSSTSSTYLSPFVPALSQVLHLAPLSAKEFTISSNLFEGMSGLSMALLIEARIFGSLKVPATLLYGMNNDLVKPSMAVIVSAKRASTSEIPSSTVYIGAVCAARKSEKHGGRIFAQGVIKKNCT